ncbi:MAG: pyridoxine 5'-phosphate synthase [Muribaculaceae bacterium]|nr:pyridoxine 5'-phosphate synthase [Muribaculaceae bacterium]
MTNLSVNINKVATLRNARGENHPDVVKFAMDCEKFGANGITVHPRPDQRHITFKDVRDLRKVVTTEYNIEGFPSKEFLDLVLEVKPDQVTLVPDLPGALTSSQGWDTMENLETLKKICSLLRDNGIRSSIFVNPSSQMIVGAANAGADRVELYTKPYADMFNQDREFAIATYIEAATLAREAGLGVNAGHDLNLENLGYFAEMIPWLDEVSIGHALISDALYYGIEDTIRRYKNELKQS